MVNSLSRTSAPKILSSPLSAAAWSNWIFYPPSLVAAIGSACSSRSIKKSTIEEPSLILTTLIVAGSMFKIAATLSTKVVGPS